MPTERPIRWRGQRPPAPGQEAGHTGGHDADYPPLIKAGRHAAARIPGCELTVAPGMAHLPPLRDPDLVLPVINGTLSRAG
jgi:pimeloyl-ACP methyl ester carboxylesterase